jgi:tetratricopeptide (TPR) repeat protein
MRLTEDDLKAVFCEASDLPAGPVRQAYLDHACPFGTPLRDRVELLLRAHDAAGRFLGSSPGRQEVTGSLIVSTAAASSAVGHQCPGEPTTHPDARADRSRHALTEGPGAVIGPCKLIEQIGEGGMGVVYVAEQHQPVRRKVALKIIRPGMDSKQVIARFEAERQALAIMDHPNIARVFDGGTTPSGRPYFVMELVRGVPITEYCDEQKLTIRERLELFVLVCRAVQHAHQKGIIHRDLKSSNILVTIIDGAAVPKVIDFGVAKATGASLTERTIYTAFQQFIGTPLYMSPEQADLAGMDVDTRSDIYSLGVLLYELLTGTTPFDQETFRTAAFDEMRRMIRDDEPPTPSTRLSTLDDTLTSVSTNRQIDSRKLAHAVKGELDWIAMKALEKDRNRRYETANDFASDVMRYLSDQPVEACPPSAWYRFRKFAMRNRKGLATTALATVSAGTVASVLGAAYLQDVSRLRQVTQDVRQSLAGARTAIEAGNLTLAGQRVAEAQGRLGADTASQQVLSAEIGAFRLEIDARQADADRFGGFLRRASDAQDKLGDDDVGGKRVSEDALGLYGILTEKSWLSHLDHSYLTAEEKQQVRETAYVTLVSLADFGLRLQGIRKDARSAARSLDLLDRAQAFHQPTRAFYFVRGRCRQHQGDTAAAAEDEKRYKASAAQTAWDFYLPGLFMGEMQGDFDQAIRSYQAALALQPNHFNSLFWMGVHLSKSDRQAEAVGCFTACIALKPGHYFAYWYRSASHSELGHLDAAISDLEKALPLATTVSRRCRTLDYLGRLMLENGQHQQGQELLRRTIAYQELLSENPDVRAPLSSCLGNLAWSLATCPVPQFRDPAQAVALARKAVEMSTTGKRLLSQRWNTLGVALYRNGDWKPAVAALEKSMGFRNGDDEAFNGFFLAMAHWQLGQRDQARTWYDRAAAWMEKNGPRDKELIRFRAEASALLDVVELPESVFARP